MFNEARYRKRIKGFEDRSTTAVVCSAACCSSIWMWALESLGKSTDLRLLNRKTLEAALHLSPQKLKEWLVLFS